MPHDQHRIGSYFIVRTEPYRSRIDSSTDYAQPFAQKGDLLQLAHQIDDFGIFINLLGSHVEFIGCKFNRLEEITKEHAQTSYQAALPELALNLPGC